MYKYSRVLSCFLLFFTVIPVCSQDRTLELSEQSDEDLYAYMLYWIDTTGIENSLDKAVLNLERGNFKSFDKNKGKNLGVYPQPTYFYLNVKNISEHQKRYWWTFYTHADTIVIYKKKLQWEATDTLIRNKLIRERSTKHRSPTYSALLEKEEQASYMAKIINPRHTQNSFVSFTSPTYNLFWEKEFYWTIGSFIGIFLITGIVSLIIGIIIRERVFMIFFIYMLTVSILTLCEELMFPIVENRFVFSVLNRVHPLPLSLIATCLNFYIVDYIFGKRNNTKLLRSLTFINTLCLVVGVMCLLIYAIFMENLNSGQTLYVLAWNLLMIGVFVSISATTLKTIILSFYHKKLHYGILFLILVVFINPATYMMNYSGIISLYKITYPNYFYWLISVEFTFIGFLIGWRYKKSLTQRHQLEMEFAQKEVAVLNDERKQIARDLHDDLGATINAIKLLITNSYPTDKRLIETVTSASNDIRVFYNKLLDKTTGNSLKESLKKLTSLHNTYGQVKFNCVFSGNETLLSDTQKENIYRIVSEIFTNILKHAQATEATIQLLIDSDSAQLIAEDNGIGFSVEQSQKTKGMGIKNIRQRVSLMKGELYISSNRGNTTYIIDIPINK